VFEVRDAVAAAFEHFQLIVEAFDEAAGMATSEIIRDFLEMVIERGEEAIETVELMRGDALHPAAQPALALAF
jgi:hypothetical protein